MCSGPTHDNKEERVMAVVTGVLGRRHSGSDTGSRLHLARRRADRCRGDGHRPHTIRDSAGRPRGLYHDHVAALCRPQGYPARGGPGRGRVRPRARRRLRGVRRACRRLDRAYPVTRDPPGNVRRAPTQAVGAGGAALSGSQDAGERGPHGRFRCLRSRLSGRRAAPGPRPCAIGADT